MTSILQQSTTAFTLDQTHPDALVAEKFMKQIALIKDSGRIDIFVNVLNWIDDMLETERMWLYSFAQYIISCIQIPRFPRSKYEKRLMEQHSSQAPKLTPMQIKYGTEIVPGIRAIVGLIKVEPYIYKISEQIDVEIAVANSSTIPLIPPLTVDVACQCEPEFDLLLQSEQNMVCEKAFDKAFDKAFEVDWITDSPCVAMQVKDETSQQTTKCWKEDIKEIKQDMKELKAMMAAMYEFEQQ